MRISASAIIVFLSAAASIAAAEDNATRVTEEASQAYVPASVIRKVHPIYPPGEEYYGREAWVRLGYCIDESGQTRNIQVLDAFGHRRLQGRAIRALENWKFSPATVGGNPVWQSRNIINVKFVYDDLEELEGASQPFLKRYDAIEAHLQAGELKRADKVFRTLQKWREMNLYEFGWLWEQRARYEYAAGNLQAVEYALTRAAPMHGELVGKQLYLYILMMRTRLWLETGKIGDAIDAFDSLVDAAGEESEEVRELEPLIRQARMDTAGNDVMRLSAEIWETPNCDLCDDHWKFRLFRRDFSLANIDGTLETVDIRCVHRRFEASVSEDTDYHVPENWGNCNVYVMGEPGTTFDVDLFPAPSPES